MSAPTGNYSSPPFRSMQVDDRVVLFFSSEDDAILFNEVVALAAQGSGYRVRLTVEEDSCRP